MTNPACKELVHVVDTSQSLPIKENPKASLDPEKSLDIPSSHKSQSVPSEDPFARFWSGQTADTSGSNKKRHLPPSTSTYREHQNPPLLFRLNTLVFPPFYWSDQSLFLLGWNLLFGLLQIVSHPTSDLVRKLTTSHISYVSPLACQQIESRTVKCVKVFNLCV